MQRPSPLDAPTTTVRTLPTLPDAETQVSNSLPRPCEHGPQEKQMGLLDGKVAVITGAGSGMANDRAQPVGPAQPQIFASVGYGSTAGPPPGWISKCKCGPVASPVAPTLPMTSPGLTWRGGPMYWDRW